LEILTAVAMNDAAQIIGRGRMNGEEQGFLLTPVPEPASLSLAVVAGAAALRRRGIPTRKWHNCAGWRCATGSSSR
jgi:MYXO-CTERM domain-containing protein